MMTLNQTQAMTEQTLTADELSDEQLEQVHGGFVNKGGTVYIVDGSGRRGFVDLLGSPTVIAG